MGRGCSLKLALVVLSMLCLLLTVHSKFSYYKTCRGGRYWYKVTVPKSGYYMVIITVDPKRGQSQHLQIRGNRNLAAFGDYVVSCLSVALPLRAKQEIAIEWPGRSRKSNFQDATALSVAYISSFSEGDFNLAKVKKMNNSYDEREWKYMAYTSNQQNVLFLAVMDNAGKWGVARRYRSFVVSKTGIYWITARPDAMICEHSTADIYNNGRKLFSVIARCGNAISTSGAFHLKKRSTVKMRVPKYKVIQAATILSYVYLALNRKPNTRTEHVAWTSLVKLTKTSRFRDQDNVVFEQSGALTNYGDMYRGDRNDLLIPETGSYLVSLRMDPGCSRCHVKGIVYVNSSPVWNAFAENGVASGQSVALHFKRSDYLYVRTFEGSTGVNTMWSVAFIGPD